MSTGSTKKTGRARFWPGVVFPVGLTLLLGLAVWQFLTSVQADQDRADAEAVRLENQARREVSDMSRRARGAAKSFIDARLEARREQEANLRFEVRGTMDAVYRVLTSCLERNRGQAPQPVAVPGFPSGFTSLEDYLRTSRPAAKNADRAVTALRACQPELAGLLPSGCSLAVIENKSIEIFSIGGGAAPENSVSVSLNREFIWTDDDQSRGWTLHLKLSAPDRHPPVTAEELAAHLGRDMGRVRLDGIAWRGWLVNASGQTVAAFPQAGEYGGEGDLPPFTDAPDEWVEMDGRRLVWLERPVKLTNFDLAPAVAVSIATPPARLEWREELLRERRWSLTLGALGLLALGMWIWFIRNIAGGRRQRAMREAMERVQRQQRAPEGRESADARRTRAIAAVSAAGEERAAPKRRLVRDETRERAVSENEDLIVADIEPDGEIRVSAAEAARILLQQRREPPKQLAPLPSGSLFRLQAKHRGGKGRPGCGVLDQARSQVLRTLAARVRPVVNVGAAARAQQKQMRVAESAVTSSRPGRVTERILKDVNR